MIFDAIVVTAFLLQIVNLHAIGKGNINYLLMIAIYSLFAVSEGWVAVADGRHSYWLFVSLSTFGALMGIRGYVRTKGLLYRKLGD